MAASLMNILDDLEARLERTQAELQALREENQRLMQQLALQNAPEPSEPGQERAATAESHREGAPEPMVTKSEASDQAISEPAASAPQAVPEHNEQEGPAEIAQTVQTAESAQAPSPHALLNQWYERYPKAFFKGHTKPLKVGIHQDLAEREEWPNKLIRRALANYVNLPRYIKAVRVGAERVDLDGQPAGKVDKEAAQHASEKRGEKKENEQPKKSPSKSKPVAPKPRQVAVEQAESEKSESHKPLSLEDKLLGLQQKFKGR
ncbi:MULTISPECIES: ProQ/FINO family protein [Halomonadaceae]|uniref:ProQ/FINO family protein n=1 Tax=Halomonadaceae TaxID=28256 RepID=UPI000C336457|nr:ProQ/FINO family protein [Halomonas sp. MES3-P3E]PKG54565.1 ABC transporter substrate-binding protein [Halomonas sp. MES3-P3E]